MFANGERFIPIAVEYYIASQLEVKDSLLIGTGRSDAALLIEISSPKSVSKSRGDRSRVVEYIWLIIEGANNLAPGLARVAKDFFFCGSGEAKGESAKGELGNCAEGNDC
jgi:hypothetical protein